jgi:hypothetical protein
MRPYLKKTHHTKKKADGVVQAVGPEFKPQYCRKNKKRKRQSQMFKELFLEVSSKA